jgi:hypothetical protein
MPVKVSKRGKYRVVDATTGKIAKNAAGTAIDGGGFASKNKASQQARAVNANKHG